MMEAIFGNQTAAQVLLHLEQKEESTPTQMARNLGIPLNMVQKQLARFEKGGLVESRYFGRGRFYRLNRRYPLYRTLRRLVKAARLFRKRRRTLDETDAGDATSLSLKERIGLTDELGRQAEFLNPYERPKPFAKTFPSLEAYETWLQDQTDPWLI